MASLSSKVEPSTRRIALCITDLDDGGAERALVRVALGLSGLPGAACWNTVVYCLGPHGPLADILEAQGIPVHCFGAKSVRKRGAVRWLATLLQLQQPHVLLSFLFHANLVSRWAGRRAKVPHIVSGHRVAEKQKSWHLWLDRWTKSLAEHHVCVSQGVADFVQQHLRLPAEQVTVIPNGVEVPEPLPDPLDLEAEFGITRGSPVVLAVGRLHPQKGFLQLLEAFTTLAKEDDQAHLVIVGEGQQREELMTAARQLKLQDRVHLPGRRDDVLAIMRAADVLALSSTWEGMPNVVLEAMAVGLPVVAFAVEGISELIVPGRTGLVVTAGDTTAFARELERILSSQKLGRELSAAAQTMCRERFTWNSVVVQYDALLSRLIS